MKLLKKLSLKVIKPDGEIIFFGDPTKMKGTYYEFKM